MYTDSPSAPPAPFAHAGCLQPADVYACGVQTVLDTIAGNATSVPPLTARAAKRLERQQQDIANKHATKSAGDKWFNVHATRVTPEVKADLSILALRQHLDPKRFYKKDKARAKNKIPDFFQVGTIIEGATDFYASRLSKKERKRTLVDEVLEDADKKQYLKRKFQNIQAERSFVSRKKFKTRGKQKR
jgi:hypothetical protein